MAITKNSQISNEIVRFVGEISTTAEWLIKARLLKSVISM